MKILVIDGHGGKMGAALVEQLKSAAPEHTVIALGTNSIATAAMIRAGADLGATGENAIIVNAPKADVIVGGIGIITANAFTGEMSPAMTVAIGSSDARRVLIPAHRCGNTIVGAPTLPLGEYVRLAVAEILKDCSGK